MTCYTRKNKQLLKTDAHVCSQCPTPVGWAIIRLILCNLILVLGSLNQSMIIEGYMTFLICKKKKQKRMCVDHFTK